jgi:hypothetical protein
MHVARLGWAFVTEARKEKGGTTTSPNLRGAMKVVRGCIAFATSGAPKVETTTSAVEAWKCDEDTRGAAKGGDAGGRQLAAKGRGDQLGQGGRFGGRFDAKAIVKPATFVLVGRGRRGPSTGDGRPATMNTLCPRPSFKLRNPLPFVQS